MPIQRPIFNLSKVKWLPMNPFFLSTLIFTHIKNIYPFSSLEQEAQFEQDFEAYLSSLDKGMCRQDLTLKMIHFLVKLNCPHTYIEDTKPLEDAHQLPFTLKKIENEWIVSQSNTNRVAIGEVLLTVNGIDVNEWSVWAREYSTGISDDDKEALVFRRLHLLSTIKEFEFLSVSGARNLCANKFAEKYKPSEYRKAIFADKVLYLNVNSFASGYEEERVIDEIASSGKESLILDLRHNSGGTTPVKLLDYLLTKPYKGFDYRSSMSLGLGIGYEKLGMFLKDRNIETPYNFYADGAAQFGSGCKLHIESPMSQQPSGIFKGKIVILTSKFTASAAEDFVFAMQQTNRAYVIGARTCGSTGQSTPIDLGYEYTLWVLTRRPFFPGGSAFEMTGIEPNLIVNETKKDILDEKDGALKKALDYILGVL